jgi:hypothetical protein
VGRWTTTTENSGLECRPRWGPGHRVHSGCRYRCHPGLAGSGGTGDLDTAQGCSCERTAS